MEYNNELNTQKLRAMRDDYLRQYERTHPSNQTAEQLVVITTLNALLRVASKTMDLEDIEKLTETGRYIIENYEKSYNK